MKRFREEGAFFASLLKADSLCFDVGANMGEKAETLLSVGMRVVAFEPQSHCITEMKARCGPYRDRLKVCQSAVGSQSGEAMLYTHKNTVVSSFREDWDSFDSSIRVPVTTIDSAIEDHGKPIYCKIDVEGWELEVLKGLTQPIPLISIEYHFKKREIEKTMACLRYLERFGEVEINITPAETLAFTFPRWLSQKEFRETFPDSFRDRVGYHYGDLFVRTCGV